MSSSSTAPESRPSPVRLADRMDELRRQGVRTARALSMAREELLQEQDREVLDAGAEPEAGS